MTENERELIRNLEAKGLLPWEPGMMIIPSPQFKPGGWWKGKPLIILSNYKYDSYDNLWLYFEGHNSASTSSCTHAPCDALIGYLVGRLQGTKHNLEIRCYSDHAIVEWRKHPAAPLCFKGKTLLEALLLAFETKLEAEK